ncbi:MAG: MOSC domain-containing protein [Lysobacteraceae bacterium]|nr:MAG: MOSC domain-containing protein [Xanthomonadaceae bacterium]
MMLVDQRGRFVTGRTNPQLTAIRCQPQGDGWRVTTPGKPSLSLHGNADGDRRLQATVWTDQVSASTFGVEVDQWFSDVLEQPVRLVMMDAQSERGIEPGFGQPGDQVSFADGYPLLLISRAAVDELNRHLSTPVKMANFRPNLVVSDCSAHAEDQWHRIRVGEVEFDLVKPCARCVFTTVDPERHQKRTDGEPLRTLVRYRRRDGKVMFGQNVIARGAGRISAGDVVEVLEATGQA